MVNKKTRLTSSVVNLFTEVMKLHSFRERQLQFGDIFSFRFGSWVYWEKYLSKSDVCLCFGRTQILCSGQIISKNWWEEVL